ncbi:MAG TPA: ElyC/SanA/YdcF family protein [Polyangia bacterium]|jgi:vancomycin permeability regulator SanA|nr:ElyC/SanA/YdcF family protein [Polyangia bacterium]
MPEVSASPPARWRWLRWLVAVVLVALAYDAGANAYVIGTARRATVADVASAPVRPYAIVLGNQVFPNGEPVPDLRERLETARALYQAGRAEKVIVSGGVVGDYNEPRAMAAWLTARGVKPDDVVLDGGGHRTAATMRGAAALGVRSALIVTQAYHLPRSLYLARHAGIDAVGVPARDRRWGVLPELRVLFRESSARAETVLEVALRGVR